MAQEKHRMVELFFKSWVDTICNNEVSINRVSYTADLDWLEIFRADFENPEDAVALKLKGIPLEYQTYIEIIV